MDDRLNCATVQLQFCQEKRKGGDTEGVARMRYAFDAREKTRCTRITDDIDGKEIVLRSKKKSSRAFPRARERHDVQRCAHKRFL